MWLVIKEKFTQTGPIVLGQRIEGYYTLGIDRKVDSLDEVESGEMFVKCNIKK